MGGVNMEATRTVLLLYADELILKYLKDKISNMGDYTVFGTNTAALGLEAMRNKAFDIIVAQSRMWDLDDGTLIEELKNVDPDCVIIMLIKEVDAEISRQMFRRGVYDFISEPLDLEKLFLLIKKGIELHVFKVSQRKLVQSLQEQNTALHRQNVLLTKRVEESSKNLSRLYENLRSTYVRAVRALAQAIDAKDHYTHRHSENVVKYAVVIAEEMKLPLGQIEILREACELHDLGKIGIEDRILSKQSGFTSEEWVMMKRHPIIGAQILEPLTFLKNGVADLVRQHHEHYDGLGYPEGRRGEEILLGARIIHLADAYESMRSARSYRKMPLSKEEAVTEIKTKSGKQFDPNVVRAFLKIVNNIDSP
jgi:response regulator RpfG family c-di-GMP phosphodiesterase